eukprot:12269223-Ditylum_brightwellii.AAC.1
MLKEISVLLSQQFKEIITDEFEDDEHGYYSKKVLKLAVKCQYGSNLLQSTPKHSSKTQNILSVQVDS